MSVISKSTLPVYPRLKEERRAYKINVEFTEINPDKPTLVCLHGYLGSLEDFNHAFEEFDNKYNVLTLDLRGHGKSEMPSDPDVGWSICDLANDVYQVLQLVIPANSRIHILASSMSTAIALELAKSYPSMIESLFLLAPTSRFIIPSWIKFILSLEKFTPERLMENFVELVISFIPKFANENDRELWENGMDSFSKMGLHIHKKILDITLANWKADLDGVGLPIFVISGADDKFVPHEQSVQLVKDLPNASLIRVENTDHFLIQTKPKIVYGILSQWLENSNAIIRKKWYDERDLIQSENGLRLDITQSNL